MLVTIPGLAALERRLEGFEEVPTTLGRILRTTAKALIARGYINTLAGAYVLGVIDGQADMLSHMTNERLDRLTGT